MKFIIFNTIKLQYSHSTFFSIRRLFNNKLGCDILYCSIHYYKSKPTWKFTYTSADGQSATTSTIKIDIIKFLFLDLYNSH